MKLSIWAISVLPLVMVPAYAETYHDCRPSEDIINGRIVHKTICQNENGEWVEPQKKKTVQKPVAAPLPVMAAQKPKPVKRRVYHDCRPSEDIVKGRPVHRIVCQNEQGDWLEVPPEALQARP
jgi:hypothetical protein